MADILIPNVKIPMYGGIVLTIYANGAVEKSNVTIMSEPPKETELTANELPSHGRLVDADELMKKVREEADFPSYEWCKAIECLEVASTIVEASDKTETSRKVHICPHCQGVCGLDEDIVCYCSSSYEMCDKYREASK